MERPRDSRDGAGAGEQAPSYQDGEAPPDEVLLTLASQLAGAAEAVQEAQLALSSLGASLMQLWRDAQRQVVAF